MKTLRAIFLAALMCGCGLALHAQSINGMKAVVHDSVVTFRDVEVLTAPVAQVLRSQFRTQPEVYQQRLGESLNENLEQLVERQLILRDFVASGYNIPESIIDEVVQDRIREQFGTRANMTRSLQAQGITYEKFRQQVRDQFIIRALRSKNVSSEIIISPYKIEEYYNTNKAAYRMEDQVKLRMIVLNKPAGDASQIRELAIELRTKIEAGADFAEMAKTYSQGSQRAQGGEWGWVERPVLRQELSVVAFSLPAGGLSDVIETPEAFYLMRVEEVKPEHYKPLSEVRDEIERILQTSEQDRLQKQYVQRLKKKTFVRYF
ncbi:MAG TPA: peptidyl-prolyl cis-trans isomerase [Verrucomicrobiota bacterium]|nr:peptidyl-prolyl cis-trans isomerase [Verrucomicrobiota bacterium]